MLIRCKSCHTATQLSGGTGPDTCECGQVYRLSLPPGKAGLDSLHRRARACARRNDIDLPAAYSITMGILKLEQVQDVQQGVRPTDGDESSTGSTRALSYDRGFTQAVEEGCLTPAQAFGRGNREALAARIAERHGLSEELAGHVADNRLTLLVALRKHRPQNRVPVVTRVGPGTRSGGIAQWAIAVVSLALVAGGVLGWQATRVQSEPSVRSLDAARAATPLGDDSDNDSADPTPREKVLRSATQVELDGKGQVTRVVGPDPRSVAIAYCDAAGEHACRVLDVTPSIPPQTRSRLGVVRDADTGAFFTLSLLQDRESRRWVAGNGATPLLPKPASEAALLAIQAR